MDSYFGAVILQARNRAAGIIPNLEDYMVTRRDTSGCRQCWALLEYGYNLHLPDEVMEDPIIQSLGEATNDFVSWTNVSGYQMRFPKPIAYPRVQSSFASFRTSTPTTVSKPGATLITWSPL